MYLGLDIGDIVKTGPGNFWVIYPSKSETLDVLPIPARRLKNSPKTMTRIEGGKHGFQVFKCSEPLNIVGKTEFFVFEWLAWEGDTDEE